MTMSFCLARLGFTRFYIICPHRDISRFLIMAVEARFLIGEELFLLLQKVTYLR